MTDESRMGGRRLARQLETEPDTGGAQTLKARLTEAVADLADSVEAMPTADERRPILTSEEMIARAKRRIADRTRQIGL